MDGGAVKYGHYLPDVFHPKFRELTFARMREEAQSAEDPWCIGYFIDNELAFAQPNSPATKALASSLDCHTRQALIGRLQEKFQSIEALNAAWFPPSIATSTP